MNEKPNKQDKQKSTVGTLKAQLTPRTGLVPSVVGVDKEAPRKPFKKNLTLNVGKRTKLVIGGLAAKDADGRQPYVTPQVIAKRLGFDLRDCILADPRELGKIEAAKVAGLKVYTVADILK